MTTLPYRRQQGTARPGGRVAGYGRNSVDTDAAADAGLEYPTTGSGALAPRRRALPAEDRTVGTRGGAQRAVGVRAGNSADDRPRAGRAASAPRLGVAPPAPVTAPRAPFVSVVLGLVVAGVLGILVLNTAINENAFRLHDLQDKQVSLDRREQQLTQDLAQQESPNSLAAAARRLGLVPAGTPAFIRLTDGQQPAAGH